jgi:hypothetical protein
VTLAIVRAYLNYSAFVSFIPTHLIIFKPVYLRPRWARPHWARRYCNLQKCWTNFPFPEYLPHISPLPSSLNWLSEQCSFLIFTYYAKPPGRSRGDISISLLFIPLPWCLYLFTNAIFILSSIPHTLCMCVCIYIYNIYLLYIYVHQFSPFGVPTELTMKIIIVFSDVTQCGLTDICRPFGVLCFRHHQTISSSCNISLSNMHMGHFLSKLTF